MSPDQILAAAFIAVAERYGFVREPTLGSYHEFLHTDAADAFGWMQARAS